MSFQIRTRADDADKHTSDVNALLYHKGKLYSGANDGKIKVWEEDLKKVTEVQAHESTVYSLTASDDTLYSCSNGGSVKAWNLNDLESKGTLIKENSEFWIVTFSEGLLYVSDDQGMVRVFEGDKVIRAYTQMEQLKGLIVLGKIMFTVRDLDLVVKEILDESNFVIKATFMGRAPLSLAGDKLCFSSRDGKDILVHETSADLQYKQVAEVKDAHEMVINSLIGNKSTSNTLLYSAGWDKVVKQWKIENGSVNLVNSCNADMVVNVLTYGEKGEIYAGGSDGHIIRIDV